VSANAILKRDFVRLLAKGVSLNDMPIECTREQLERWFSRVSEQIEKAEVPTLTTSGRRINNFCLGSDPEFVFVAPGATHKVAAATLGLRPGLAAGCDQNQRLAELRIWPTASALEHVAGILTALRWMYRLYPDCRNFQWRAGGWFDNDGIGGHVHFGRKRPNRNREIEGLNGLAKALQDTAFFQNAEWIKRQGGDNRNQRYGAFGDIREQLHGYEYRTLPSWLDSPTKAFTVLTLSKLAVIDPELTASWFVKGNVAWDIPKYFSVLRYLVNYYAGLDDDAKILQYVLSKSNSNAFHPWYRNSDFRAAWGCNADGQGVIAERPKSNILSAVVAPLPSEIEEITAHLVSNKFLTFVNNPPTFKNELPKGYVWLYDHGVLNIARGGVGDITHNVVFHEKDSFNMSFGSDRGFISSKIAATWTPEERNRVKEMFPTMRIRPDVAGIIFDREATMVPGIRNTREFIFNMGLFPVWTVDSVREDSRAKFLESRATITAKKLPQPEERVL